jgi:hypothetical protein
VTQLATTRPWVTLRSHGGCREPYSSSCVDVSTSSEVWSIEEGRDSSFGPGPLFLRQDPRLFLRVG